MSTSHLTAQFLRQLSKLAERKDKLGREIAKIDAKLASLISGGAAAAAPKKKGRKATKKSGKKAAKRTAKRGKRGALGKKVLAALEAAGPAGIRVAELADKLGVKATNLHVWFGTTGKKHAKRVGRGQYAAKKK